MDTEDHGAAWVLVLSEEAKRRERPAHFGTPGLRSPKATHDTLPGGWHGGVGDASNISEQQLVEKLSGII